MWYLSRTPCFSSSQDSVLSRTSIFSASDTGYLEDLSFVITEEEEVHDDAYKIFGNPWQWFTYECAPMQFTGVAVPRRTQIISVMPNYFVCARVISSPSTAKPKAKPEIYAKLCTYSRKNNELVDYPSCMELEEGHDRNLLTAASALMGGYLYVAGGYKAISSSDLEAEPPAPLNSAERFNIATLQWETLPAMIKPQAYSTGIASRGLFYCIGDENYVAQIFNPTSNKWSLDSQFIPREADGYTVGSVNGNMILLTWSTIRGVKLWRRITGANLVSRWIVTQFCFDTKVARTLIDQKGAKLVRIQKDIFIMVGVTPQFCWVDGLCAWPILPAPAFRPCDRQKVLHTGHVWAFRFVRQVNEPTWRQFPMHRIGCAD